MSAVVGRASRSGITGWARRLRLAQLVALVIGLAFAWRVSLAYLTPCVVHDAGGAEASGGDGCCPGERRTDPAAAASAGDEVASLEAADAPGDDDGQCSCPIDCGACCGGAVMHALAPSAPPPTRLVVALVDLPVPGPPALARHAPTGDILHVPRLA